MQSPPSFLPEDTFLKANPKKWAANETKILPIAYFNLRFQSQAFIYSFSESLINIVFVFKFKARPSNDGNKKQKKETVKMT